MSPPTRFGDRYRDEIVGAGNVHLYTHAVATEILANESVRAIDGLRVATLDGKEHRVCADHYVLACNTIQNARLLLASNKQTQSGIGNDHDLVGRYFMEHFEMVGAQLVLADRESARMYERSGRAAAGEFAISESLQEEYGVLNGTTSLRPGAVDEEELIGFFQRFSDSSMNRLREAERESREEDERNDPRIDVANRKRRGRNDSTNFNHAVSRARIPIRAWSSAKRGMPSVCRMRI